MMIFTATPAQGMTPKNDTPHTFADLPHGVDAVLLEGVVVLDASRRGHFTFVEAVKRVLVCAQLEGATA